METILWGDMVDNNYKQYEDVKDFYSEEEYKKMKG